MFISQLELDFHPDNELSRNWIKNPYRVHQRLWMAFESPTTDKEKAPFLYQFNLKKDERNHLHSNILVLSNEKPDWKKAFFDFPVLKHTPDDSKVKELILNNFILASATFRFSLTGNPTKKVKYESNGLSEREKDKQYNRLKSKRIGLYKEHEQIEWIQRRGKEKDGFELLEVYVEKAEDTKVIKTKKNDKQEIPKLHTVTFSGILRVTNAEQFKQAYTNGIGSGKAFGCGMLLLART